MKTEKIIQFSIGPFGAALLNLVTLPVVAWIFSAADVGRLNMLQVILGLGTAVFSVAMHQAYVREYHEVTDKCVLLKTAIYPGIWVLSLTIFVSSFYSKDITFALFGLRGNLPFWLLVMCFIFSFLINFLSHVLRMEERALAFSFSQVTPKFSVLIGLMILIMIGVEKKYTNLMSIQTVSLGLTTLALAWITKESLRGLRSVRVNKELLSRMTRFSLPLVFGGVTYWGLVSMDRFFIRALSGFDELAIYAMAAAFASAATVVSTIFSNLWHPIVYRWIVEGVDQKKLLGVMEGVTLLVAFLWSATGLFSWVVLYFLPNDYLPVDYLLVVCLAMPLFYLLSEATGVGIGVSRRSHFLLWASLISFCINAILNYILIPIFGAGGAGIASVIAFYAFFLLKTEFSSRAWINLPRFKIYAVMFLYTIYSIVVVGCRGDGEFFVFGWAVLLFLTMIVFNRRIIALIKQFRR